MSCSVILLAVDYYNTKGATRDMKYSLKIEFHTIYSMRTITLKRSVDELREY